MTPAKQTGILAKLRHWRGRGLPTRFLLPLFALLLVAIWMATFHFVRIDRAASDAAAADSVQALVDTYAAQLAQKLANIDQTLKALKHTVELKGAAAALPHMRQQGLLPSGGAFVVSIADRDGRIVASNPAAATIEISAQSYYEFHRSSDTDSPFVSEIVRDAAHPEPHLHFTRRINDAGGHFAGIAIFEADPAYFTSGYERSRLGAQGVLGMYGSNGLFRAMRVGDTVSWGQRASPALAERRTGASASSWDGVWRYTGVRRLHGFPLSAIVALDRDEQMAAFEKRRRTYLWAAACASVVLVLIVTLLCIRSWQLARIRRRIGHGQ